MGQRKEGYHHGTEEGGIRSWEGYSNNHLMMATISVYHKVSDYKDALTTLVAMTI